ncbi:S8 family peptidase [Cronobacter turicensis]|uniref:S8 family peptidase n=1 Tax=Cronobacter turicensis TaxID=413502 RepID=UPI001DBBB025|nr:S8 family peptidase [Cronobacter turicensis]EGT4493042.1 hypothetical protein [Cronobacter turicensis]EKM0439935.1 S8 family peptidase [Cronobacter turicensis]ELY4323111.1 S8 family peptidase [Cronobacter turicensis]ELY4324051.1 S8 family peptidase [Cronobacter turicensis]ELY5944335.1 S8 family peptidase [Cronobacter turicensis]
MSNNNPVQIILDTNQYIKIPVREPNGSKTDFFAGRDELYKEHKRVLLGQISNVKKQLHQTGYAIGVLMVELNREALAKSHRPVKSLLPLNKSPLIGSKGIGQLLFQVTPASLEHLSSKITSSEEHTNYVTDNNGKIKPKPSIVKSETGAIARLSFFGVEEKIGFSLNDIFDWYEEGDTFSGYLVELVDFQTTESAKYKVSLSDIDKMRQELIDKLHMLGAGLFISKLTEHNDDLNTLIVQLLNPKDNESVISFNRYVERRFKNGDIDMTRARHQLLITVLASSPLVRKVSLPPKIRRDITLSGSLENAIEFPVRIDGHNYPKVGIIDTGIHNSQLVSWCDGVSNGFDINDCDPNHGSQVASIIVAGRSMNPNLDSIDQDGCVLYDIWMPIHNDKSNTFSEYFSDIGEFFEWLDYEISIAVKSGFRIFNFSLNFEDFVRDDSYSVAAAHLDQISEKHNVIFVISSGNLSQLDYRSPWKNPPSPYLFSDIDRLTQPAESVRSITVGAVNPPGCSRNIHGGPTIYTRRGPGVSMGVKPDLIHYGGYVNGSTNTGLVTADGNGSYVEAAGTSFSAPIVAKILAGIDHRTKGVVPRNTLIAMLIHHSRHTQPLSAKELQDSLVRRLAGFGMPRSSEDMLHTDDHSITLVLSGLLQKGEELNFDFTWPNSLITNEGKCTGKVTMTLVYDPVIKRKFGAEYCRVNVDAVLQQDTLINKKNNTWAYRKKSESIWQDRVGKEANYEKHQIEHGLKWWPVKKAIWVSKDGVGASQNWRLKISSLERAVGDYPQQGLSFSVILTIEDFQNKSSDLFNEVRRSLNSLGVKLQSIDISTHITVRS